MGSKKFSSKGKTINLILLGRSGVGKTALIRQLETGQFYAQDVLTIGVEVHVKKLSVEGEDVTLYIYDTAGQETFNSLCSSYYRRGDGALLVYDVTEPDSFESLPEQLQKLKEFKENAVVLIAGNKDDFTTRKRVDLSKVKEFAKRESLDYMETSAKSGKNVEEAFIYLAKKVLLSRKDPKNHKSSDEDDATIKVGVTEELEKEEGFCNRLANGCSYIFGGRKTLR